MTIESTDQFTALDVSLVEKNLLGSQRVGARNGQLSHQFTALDCSLTEKAKNIFNKTLISIVAQ